MATCGLKKGQRFDALDSLTGKRAKGCPCRVRLIKSACIEAVDRDGNLRTFYFHGWKFEPVK